MILIVLATVLLIFATVFLISAVIMGANLKRLRNPRAYKLLKKRRRNTVILTLISFAGGVLLLLSYLLPLYRMNQMKNGGYDLAQTYASVLKNAGEDRAYLYLPTEIEPYGDTFAVRNGRNEWFSYESVETAENSTKQKWLFQCNKTLKAAKINLSGEQVMEIHLAEDGRLYAAGLFPYMKYDGTQKAYSGVLARNVSDFYCSGNTLYYLTDESKLYAVGYNEYGQMGDATNRNKTTPVLIYENVTAVSGSATHAMFVDRFGNVYAMGDNSESGLGDGTMTNAFTPVRVMSGAQSVAVGNFFSVILAQNGDVYTCGRNSEGQCGNGTKNGTAKPVKIAEGAKKIAANGESAAYMTADGTVFAWGKNTDKSLSSGDAIISKPTQVAQNAYDIAFNNGTLGILTRTRTVMVSGRARSAEKELFQTILDLEAQVPEEYQNPFIEEDKPDISELGQ